MKFLSAWSASLLVCCTPAAMAAAGDDACALDAHQKARRLFQQPMPAWSGSGESATPAPPVDPHELARLRLVPRSAAYGASLRQDATPGSAEVDPHQRAQSLMLSSAPAPDSTGSLRLPRQAAGQSPRRSGSC